MKIAHLSDIYIDEQTTKRPFKKLVKKIEELEADIVVIIGDFADGSLEMRSERIEPFNNLTIQILYVTGNHEQMFGKEHALIKVAKTKIKHIGDKIWDEKGIRFICVDYESNLKEKLDDFSNNDKLDYNSERLNILLSLVPSLKPKELKKWNILLFLDGHTYTGQYFPCHLFTYFFILDSLDYINLNTIIFMFLKG